MNIFFFLLMLTSLNSFSKTPEYQVTTSHLHELKELTPYVKTVSKSGRLWIVTVDESAPNKIKTYLRPVSGSEKSYFHQEEIDSKQGFKKSRTLERVLEHVDKLAIKRDVEKLSSYRTRYSGTSENQEAVLFVSSRLIELGLDVKSDCFSSGVCNIIAEKKGSFLSDEVILVMAHIDSVMANFAGADDNASGMAVLMEMARLVSSYPNRHTIRFLITNAEEKGLLGSKDYVNKLVEQNKIKNLTLAINMDMVGYNSDNVVELETNPEFESMARWYADLAGSYTKLKTKITLGAWGSDHVPFLNQGVPSILTIENWETRTPCYHLKCDKPETLNYDYAAEIGKLNLAAVLTKDTKE